MTSTPQPPVVQLAALKSVKPQQAVSVILAISAAALALLVVVIYGHGRAIAPPAWLAYLPLLNAVLNASSATLLVFAVVAIKQRRVADHARYMLAALSTSTLFLVSYIVYHSAHGDTPFHGVGVVRPIYFAILISHVLLSALVLPLIFTSFFFSLAGRFPQHKKVSRYTFPIWLYVSVTGVLVFVMLRIFG